MTYKEMLATESIKSLIENIASNKFGCPCEFGYEENRDCPIIDDEKIYDCVECWNREAQSKMQI